MDLFFIAETVFFEIRAKQIAKNREKVAVRKASKLNYYSTILNSLELRHLSFRAKSCAAGPMTSSKV
jgi:hypothetical protein